MTQSGNIAIDIKPCLKLWASVFLLTIDDAWSKDALIRDPAREWISSDANYVNSFRRLCELFDLEPSITRQKILGSRTAVSELRRRVSAQEKTRRKQTQAKEIR